MKNNSYILIFSIIITLLAAIAAAEGLWIKNLYNDNAFAKSAWYSNDIITLFVVVPFLVMANYLSQKGSQRWLMVLMGLIGYVFYNFEFYLFGAAFNIFFLIYTVWVSMSAITLVIQLSNPGFSNVATKFAEKTPVKELRKQIIINEQFNHKKITIKILSDCLRTFYSIVDN